VSRVGLTRLLQCPASRRALSFGLAAGLLAVSACGYVPRPVAGLPPGAPWEALPLRKWLAEDRAEPEALSFCAPPECRPGLAVVVVRLTGRDAEITDNLLKDPERLARALRSPAGRTKPVKTAVSVEPLKENAAYGFAIALAPADEGKSPAFGAALGRRDAADLRVVLAIGEDPVSVRTRVREVADRELLP
jgi:hypothetical protein